MGFGMLSLSFYTSYLAGMNLVAEGSSQYLSSLGAHFQTSYHLQLVAYAYPMKLEDPHENTIPYTFHGGLRFMDSLPSGSSPLALRGGTHQCFGTCLVSRRRLDGAEHRAEGTSNAGGPGKFRQRPRESCWCQ